MISAARLGMHILVTVSVLTGATVCSGQCRERRLIAGDAELWDSFGVSVSLNGDRALVGSSGDYVGGVQSAGSAYVFRRDDNGTPSDPTDDSWVNEAKLVASDGSESQHFGNSVSLDGDRALIGAVGWESDDYLAGSAYVFRRDDNSTPNNPTDDLWVEEAKLVAGDGVVGDKFGFSVSLFGDRALIGARYGQDSGLSTGAAYVFRRDDNGTPIDPTDDFWVEEAKLLSSDGAYHDSFGYSVSLFRERALIGAFANKNGGITTGSAYLFGLQDNGTPSDPTDDYWVEEHKLVASDASFGQRFGYSVSLGSERALVGARGDNWQYAGGAYVFRYDDNGTPGDATDDFWVEEAKLLTDVGSDYDYFGYSVSLNGDLALIGAPYHQHSFYHFGSAFLFRRDDNGTPGDATDDYWVEDDYYWVGSNTFWAFAASVSLDRGRALIGSLGDAATGVEAGAAYVFSAVPDLASVQYAWGDPAPGYAFYHRTMLAWLGVRIENRSPCAVRDLTLYLTDLPSNMRLEPECSEYAFPGCGSPDCPPWPECDPQVSFPGVFRVGESKWSTPDTFVFQVDLDAEVDPCDSPTWTIEYDDLDGDHHVLYRISTFPTGEGPPPCSGDFFGIGDLELPVFQQKQQLGVRNRPRQ